MMSDEKAQNNNKPPYEGGEHQQPTNVASVGDLNGREEGQGSRGMQNSTSPVASRSQSSTTPSPPHGSQQSQQQHFIKVVEEKNNQGASYINNNQTHQTLQRQGSAGPSSSLAEEFKTDNNSLITTNLNQIDDQANENANNELRRSFSDQQNEEDQPEGELIESEVDDVDEDEEEEEEEEDEEQEKVAEISPKGRFKRFYTELGRGAYKVVYKGIDHDKGLEIAWNSISLLKLPPGDRARIKKEIDLIKMLEHPNIIHFISGWQNKEKQEVIFITEITSGTLRRYIKKNKITKLRVIKGWCQSILEGLSYLHEQQMPIIHRDLKCDNIFINSNSGEIRIGDLGLSTPMNNSYTSSVLGTPEFMAPELYEEHYDCKVDIYAFGMCMIEMITQSLPYKECMSPAQIYKKVTAGEPPLALSRIQDTEVHEFIAKCLHADKTQRPTAREILESDFIQTTDDEKSNQAVPLGPPVRRPTNFKRKKSFLQNCKQSVIPEEEEETSDQDKSSVMDQKLNQQQQSKDAHHQTGGGQQSALSSVAAASMVREDINQTMAAGKIESQIREMNAEEQQDDNLDSGCYVAQPLQSQQIQQQQLGSGSNNNNEPFKPVKLGHMAGIQRIQSLANMPNHQNSIVNNNDNNRRESILSSQSANPVVQHALSMAMSSHNNLFALQNSANSASSDNNLAQPPLSSCSQGTVSVGAPSKVVLHQQQSSLDGGESCLVRYNTDRTEQGVQEFDVHKLCDDAVSLGSAMTVQTSNNQQICNKNAIDQAKQWVDLGASSQQQQQIQKQQQSPSQNNTTLAQQNNNNNTTQKMENMENLSESTKEAGYDIKTSLSAQYSQQENGREAPMVGGFEQHRKSSGLDIAQQQPQVNNFMSFLNVQQTNSDGNQSQSSGMTMRKMTDVGNPDCTFSDPKFVQENTLEDQSLVSNSRDQTSHFGTNQPFAGIGAHDILEQSLSRKRIESQEACFGGSGSDDANDLDDKDAYSAQYSDDDNALDMVDEADEQTDDDEESIKQKMNESLRFLNQKDREKHMNYGNGDIEDNNNVSSSKSSNEGGPQLQKPLPNPIMAQSLSHHQPVVQKGNILDDFKQRLEHEDEMVRSQGIQSIIQPNNNNNSSILNHPIQVDLNNFKIQKVDLKKKQSLTPVRSRESLSSNMMVNNQTSGQSMKKQSQIVKKSPRHSIKQLQDAINNGNNGMMPKRGGVDAFQLSKDQATSPKGSILQQTQSQLSNIPMTLSDHGFPPQAQILQQNLQQPLLNRDTQQQLPQLQHQSQNQVIQVSNPQQQIQQQQQTQQQVAVVKQPATNDQKKSTLFLVRKFGEDDMDKGGAQLLIDQTQQQSQKGGQTGTKSKSNSIHQTICQLNSQNVSAGINNAALEPQNITQSTQSQLLSQQPKGQITKTNNNQQQINSAQTLQLQQQMLQQQQQLYGLSNEQEINYNQGGGDATGAVGGGNVSEYDEQRSSSESDDSDISDDEIAPQIHTLQKSQHKANNYNVLKGSSSQRHLGNTTAATQSQAAAMSTKQSSGRHSGMAVSSTIASQQNSNMQQAQSSSGQFSQLVPQKVINKSDKSKSTTKASKASSTNLASASNFHHQSRSIMASIPQGQGDLWTVVSTKEKIHQQSSNLDPKNGSNFQQQSTSSDFVKPGKHQKEKMQSQNLLASNKVNQNGQREKQRTQVDKTRSSSNMPTHHRSESANRQPTPKTGQTVRKQDHSNNGAQGGGQQQAHATAPQKQALLQQQQNPADLETQTKDALTLQQQNMQSAKEGGAQPAQQQSQSSWQRKSKNVINITISYPQANDQKWKGASFDFNIIQDTPSGVANEMVRELQVDPNFRNSIKQFIEASVRQFQTQEKEKEIRQASARQIQTQEKLEKEKEIKHQFRKLQSHLDSFFVEMKQNGLQGNKEICRVFESLYPAPQPDEQSKRNCYIDALAKLNKIMKQSNNHQSSSKQASSSQQQVQQQAAIIAQHSQQQQQDDQ